jgi:hypothetical protein
VLAALLLCALPSSQADAQTVSLRLRQATLPEVIARLSPQVGYQFRLAVSREIETARHDFECKEASLPLALLGLGSAFGCDFYSTDLTGFFVVAPSKGEVTLQSVGPFRMRASGVTPSDGAGTVRVPLYLSAADPARIEAIAGLGPDLRALDNFGRDLLPPSSSGLRITTSQRFRPGEYSQTLILSLRDDRAVRIRAIRGSVALYRRLTPVRLEFPIPGGRLQAGRGEQSASLREGQVRGNLDSVLMEEDVLQVRARLAWPEAVNMVATGIARTPVPYVVDVNGQVVRDYSPERARIRRVGGQQISEQVLRFESLEAPPARLVYDLLAREEPDEMLPFRLAALPLPEREDVAPKPESRAFFASDGGSISFAVVDQAGKAVEGETDVGLELRGPQGWSGRRWIEVISDPDGRVKIEHLRPGRYRVHRVFRFDPTRPPVSGAQAEIEVVVTAGKGSSLPPLRLPLTAPPE